MTYIDIKARLGVPLATLSTWFKDQQWSNDVARETIGRVHNASRFRFAVINTVRDNRIKKIYEEARQDALGDYHDLKYHPLFIAGVMTYWSHGDKTSRSRISVSSTDAKVIKIFCLFIEMLCGMKKATARLLLKEYVDELAAKEYWMVNGGLKSGHFAKSIRIKSKTNTNRQKYGVCNVSVNSAYLKNKILRWIDLLVEDISQENYIAGMV